MLNKATMAAISKMRDLEVTMGTGRAADILGISPKGFKRYLENCRVLPDYAVEVTDEGERRTFRILTQRFAYYLSAGEMDADALSEM